MRVLTLLLAILSIVNAAPNRQFILKDPSLSPQSAEGGDKVVRFTFPSTSINAVKESLSWIESLELDIWHQSATSIDLVLSDTYEGLVTTLLASHKPIKSIIIKNIRNEIALQQNLKSVVVPTTVENTIWDPIHNSYHPLSSIVAVLNLFVGEFPDFAELITIGTSSEGRDILGLRGQLYLLHQQRMGRC